MLYTTIFWAGVILWVYLLSVLKRAKLAGYYFILGSVGLFSAMIFYYLVWLFSTTLTQTANIIGEITGTFTAVPPNILQIIRPHETLYLWIDFECQALSKRPLLLG